MKRFTGPPHPDRERQFNHIQTCQARFLQAGLPVLSVDTKKKELIGNFANAGRTWRAQPAEVNAHDFKQDARARAVPYGLYDVQRQRGHVRVGLSGDTPRFAVSAIAHWWRTEGRRAYRTAQRLCVLADAGGSNSCRTRAWKYELQRQLADPFGITVTVCHYPTGASKWNPVEHRLFGPVSLNWAGEPLTSLRKMLALLRGTSATRTTASLDRRSYLTGQKVTPQQMTSVRLLPHRICPQWNYSILPHRRRPSLDSGP